MVTPFEMFETKDEFEIDGVWQDFGDFKVLLARSGGKNTAYLKMLSDEVKKLGKATFEALAEEEMIDIIRLAFCKTVIKDHEVKIDGVWKKGVYVKNEGKVEIVPFQVDNMILCLKQLPEYFKQLQEWANDYKVFQDEVIEDQVKN